MELGTSPYPIPENTVRRLDPAPLGPDLCVLASYFSPQIVMIHQTPHFTVEIPASPHVDRLDGGHLIIYPRVPVLDRTHLAPPLAQELMMLTMVVGEAMAAALNRRGIDVVRINYQDNGNWGFRAPAGPHLHIHLYGRAASSVRQRHGEALFLPLPETGAYEGIQPLNAEDGAEIRRVIENLRASAKYRDFATSPAPGR